MMSDDLLKKKRPKAKGKKGRDIFSSRWLLVGIVGVGLCLSLVAYFVLNAYVAQDLKKTRDMASSQIADVLGSGLIGFENSLHQGAEMLRLVSEVSSIKSNDSVVQKLRNLDGESFKNYKEFIWLRQKDSSAAWRVHSYFVQDKPDNVLISVIMAKKTKAENFIQKVLKQGILNESGARVLHFDSGSVLEGSLVLAQSFRSNQGQANNILLVRVHTERLVRIKLVDFQDAFQNLSVRNLETAQILLEGFTIENVARSAARRNIVSYRYDLLFGAQSWEVQFDLHRNSGASFPLYLPFFVMILGLFFMVLSGVSIFIVLRKLSKSNGRNESLETHNFELDSEVSERSRLYEALQRSEAENRAVIDAVSDIIFEVDVQGNLIFLNSAWRKVTGFDIEQSSGNNLFSMLHPNDQEKQQEDFKLLTRGQKNAYRSFTRIRTADGTFRAVELAVSMIRQDINQNLRVVGTLTDVEERRRAERALSEAEKKYRTIVENAAGGIYQLTPEGLYLNVNPAFARILGYESPELVLRQVKNANESVYADIKDRMRFIRDLEKAGVVNSYEVEVVRKDGRRIWANENVRVVRDDLGNILYYEGSLEDITPRKESEIFLSEAKIKSDLANRAKSEFLANMSHELRTPLNAIIGFSEIIKNQILGPVENEEYLNYATDIFESGNGLLKVINEILDISKIEAGDRQLDDSVVDMSKAVQNALDMLAGRVMDSEMSVVNTLKDIPEIIGEELALKQVILNLLSNAVKFTPHGGRVTISHQMDQAGRFRLSFTDTGIGLDEAEIEKALSPFGQVDNSLSRTGSGTGLGLTLVDALLKMHGGELELFSQKGTGTTATIILPAERVQLKAVKKDADIVDIADGTEQV